LPDIIAVVKDLEGQQVFSDIQEAEMLNLLQHEANTNRRNSFSCRIQ